MTNLYHILFIHTEWGNEALGSSNHLGWNICCRKSYLPTYSLINVDENNGYQNSTYLIWFFSYFFSNSWILTLDESQCLILLENRDLLMSEGFRTFSMSICSWNSKSHSNLSAKICFNWTMFSCNNRLPSMCWP